jgi:hypothetical protein
MSTPFRALRREDRDEVVALVLHQLEVETEGGQGRPGEHGPEALAILVVELRKRRLEVSERRLHALVAGQRRQCRPIRECQRSRIWLRRRSE